MKTIQSINTESLDTAISQLRNAQANMNDAFEKVSNQATILRNSWKSTAGSKAETRLYEFLKANEARDAVLSNYIAVLTQVVEQGYLSVEEANTTLASYFK